MGRGYRYIHIITIRMDDETFHILQRLSEKYDVSVSEIIRRAIRLYDSIDLVIQNSPFLNKESE